jgi:hypothetical protein
MASSLTVSKSDRFSVGTSEGTRLCIPCRDYRRFRGKISGSCDKGRGEGINLYPANVEYMVSC